MDSLVLIGSCCLVCLLPLSLYFLFLSSLHSRGRPVLVNGRWDFACLLMGISGFLLILGPLLLTILDSTWRGIWVSGQLNRLRSVLEKEAILWSGLGTIYILAVSYLIIMLLRSRSWTSVIYGLPANRFGELFTTTLERTGRKWRTSGHFYEIHERLDHDAPIKPNWNDPSQFTEVEVEPFPSMSLISLHWDSPKSTARSEIEFELEKSLDRIETPSSPVSGWFMTASVSIFLVMLVWMGFLIFTMWTSGKRI